MCNFATPFTLWLPTIARLAILTKPSPIIAILEILSHWPIYLFQSSAQYLSFISSTIIYILGRSSLNIFIGHFSKASDKIVWFVYDIVFVVILIALSHERPSSSNKILISSGIAKVGWVSFI